MLSAALFCVLIVQVALPERWGMETALGQTMVADDAGPTVPTPPANEVREVTPEIFYLLSESGKLVPVPDLKLEDYRKLYDQLRGLTAPDPPPYVLQRLELHGKDAGGHAELTADFQIRLTEQAAVGAWVRVPLRLSSLVLRGAAKFEGDGEKFLAYEAERDGYVCWIRAEPKSQHRLRLEMASPLEVVGGSTRLNLSTPKVPSHVTMQVPYPRVEAEVSQQNTNILRPPRTTDRSTLLEMDGLGGDVQLRWRPAPQQKQNRPPRLDVVGAIRIAVESLGQISTEAQLRIRSFGGPVDTFKVRLPKRMHLVPLEQPGYRVALASPQPKESDAEGELVEVRLNAATSNEVNVRLLMERLPDERADGTRTVSWMDVGAISVEGAVRQRGYVDFSVEGEFALEWKTGEGVTRRDEIPETVRQQGVIARFEYFRQPCSLQVQLRPKQKRVRVDPSYHLHVGGGQIRLTASLRYRVNGESAVRLRSDFSGWTVESVDRGDLDMGEGVATDQVSPLEVPIVADGKTLAEGFAIRVDARRDYDPTSEQLTIPLPDLMTPDATPAEIVVTVADNVSLDFRDLDGQGLTIDSDTEPAKRRHRFRENAGASVKSLVAGLSVSPRLVTLQANQTLTLAEDVSRLTQEFRYDVQYAAIDRLRLRVPKLLLDEASRQPEVTGMLLRWAGEPVAYELIENSESAEVGVLIEIPLPEPTIGEQLLVIESTLPGVELSGEASQPFRAALVVPAKNEITRLVSNALQVQCAEQFVVEAEDRRWAVVTATSVPSLAARSIRLAADELVPDANLMLQKNERVVSPTMHVSRGWLQSILTSEDRLDRFSFRVSGAGASVQVQLPEEANTERVRVSVDRQPLSEVFLDEANRLTIPLADEREEEQAIDVWYWHRGRTAANRLMAVSAPKIVDVDRVDRMLWQIVTPPNEHLIVSPVNATPEVTWRWEGLFWARRPNLEQREIEEWIGGENQERLPTANNKYLFLTLGSSEPIKFVLASRHLIVLIVSGLILVVGLALIYRPALQHPAVLMVLGVGLGLLAFWSTEVTLLLAQSAALGVLLYLLGRLLDWSMGGRRRRTAGLRGLAGPDSKTIEYAPAHPPEPAATSAAPAVYPVPDTDSR